MHFIESLLIRSLPILKVYRFSMAKTTGLDSKVHVFGKSFLIPGTNEEFLLRDRVFDCG